MATLCLSAWLLTAPIGLTFSTRKHLIDCLGLFELNFGKYLASRISVVC